MPHEKHDWVTVQIEDRGVTTPAVLEAMRQVPREAFVPEDSRSFAHADAALSIGEGQTISQPYIVALMTDLLDLNPGDRVLDVGTGSGYQAAVLAEMGADVWSVEISDVLAEAARARLSQLGYDRIHLRTGDGHAGWPEGAPFKGILVAACTDSVPRALKEQLAVGGRLILPLGDDEHQELTEVRRVREDKYEHHRVLPVRFVPMTGRGRDKT